MNQRATDLTTADASVTSHVLDAGSGRSGRLVPVRMFRNNGDTPELLSQGVTNDDGRFEKPLLTTKQAQKGAYRLTFAVSSAFFDDISVDFNISDVAAHHHIPLALSPFGFMVYRGAPPHRAPREHGTPPDRPLPPAVGVAPMPGTGGAGLTTHAIDIAQGTGAGGMQVSLFSADGTLINSLVTTTEGRTASWLVPAGDLVQGSYELAFDIGRYFGNGGLAVGEVPFFTTARVRFRVSDPNEHYHLPLIAAPWGYSCYRGS